MTTKTETPTTHSLSQVNYHTLVPDKVFIKSGPTRFNWEMAKLGKEVVELGIGSRDNDVRFIQLRVSGTLQVNPMHQGVMFWGWIRNESCDKNELLDDRFVQELIAHRQMEVSLIEFVCGIYMPSNSNKRGWIAPCSTQLPKLFDTFKEVWADKD